MSPDFTKKDLIDWATACLVFLSGSMTGHYAAVGMNAVQWMGAITAVLGSVAVAVAVRVWPPVAAGAGQPD
ncbi:MAG: hypothetical protein JNL41_11460 [Phenylobacterium sp.]|uniref:hypothetical protein n=1 Tax=Phenylobacterium sp. TaxID=1871053 RepID=UPI001A38DCCB|nr:hypothetical protein [Phenylobacterium sp.]MBL8554886.1 hypothetical protein [Phenylobacterium sp.]